MLPANFYNGPDHGQYGDKAFLIEWLHKLPPKMQKPVSDRYSDIYAQLSEEAPNECRFRANCWLRKTVAKVRAKVKKENCDGLPF